MLTAERLRELLDYDPETGVFRWKVDRANRLGAVKINAGMTAGSISGLGYRLIGIDGRRYLAHRLAVLHVTGHWPENQVDHKDENRANNSWANLRVATKSQNMCNRGAQRNNTSGFKGVSLQKNIGRWLARIQVNKKPRVLGFFATKEEAAVAYAAAARELHGDFARVD